MSVFLSVLGVLSAAFFLVWQYRDSPWVLFAYLLAVFALCLWYSWQQRRKREKILARIEDILASPTSRYMADDTVGGTERKLILWMEQLRAREDKVEDGYHRISSLVADIAHQTKTPMAAILMYTELTENTTALRSQTEKLAFLLESLTKLAKCEGGLIAENLHPQKNSMVELVRMAVQTQFAAADEKGMDIYCQVPDGLTAVFDMHWTAEAVGNLLDNGVKYGPAGSRISIVVTAYDLFVRLDVTSEGDTIPEDERGHIWKRFYRGKNAVGQNGVGIGLYLTAHIVQAQGGRVSVQAAETGNVFSVFLPKCG